MHENKLSPIYTYIYTTEQEWPIRLSGELLLSMCFCHIFSFLVLSICLTTFETRLINTVEDALLVCC